VALLVGAASAQVYRTIDGSGNNFAHPNWGAAGSDYLREASGAHYIDGLSAPPGLLRPSARLISNLVVNQAENTEDERGLSTCVYEFGQFLDHDIGLADTGTTEPLHIAVPIGDPSFDPTSTGTQVIPFYRSVFDPATGLTRPRQQVNGLTAFVDASQVYGSDAVRAAWLRQGTGGRLKVTVSGMGDLMPFNDGTMTNANPVNAPATSLYVAGDVRANEQVGLIVMHTVFLREHNWQAARLAALHPTWTDEQLYQEARRWVGAEMQVIVYREFLPAILGHPLPAYAGYNAGVNPGLSNAFATAGYRVGHSMVGDDIDLLDENFEEFGIIELRDAFFNPAALNQAGGIEPIVRYFAASIQQKTDTKIVDPLRNFLFGPPGAGGFDLASLNIQRGRDHGLADYNTLRTDFGLPPVQSFTEITSDAALAQDLQSLYGTVNDIDPWVGMLAEDHVTGSSLGVTHQAIISDQFLRLRDGDRYWYQNGQFTPAETAALESTRLSDIFRRNTTIPVLQGNVFFAATFPLPCYANCDGSTNPPILNVNDFVCFQNRFAAADPWADCDQSGSLNVNDFVCFMNTYGAGCP
jgi:hypothetical protein